MEFQRSCKNSGYKVKFIIYNDKANFEDLVTDYEHPKALILLLKNTIEELKNIGIKNIIQCVDKYDHDNYLKNKTSWKIIKHHELTERYDIECDINKFMNNMLIGWNLNL